MQNPATSPIIGYEGSSDTTTQQHWLDVAWRALQAEVPDLAIRAAADPEIVALAADVVSAAARRVLRNPSGVESESGAIDVYSESFKYADVSLDVYFTAAELRRLVSSSAQAGDWSGSVKYL